MKVGPGLRRHYGVPDKVSGPVKPLNHSCFDDCNDSIPVESSVSLMDRVSLWPQSFRELFKTTQGMVSVDGLASPWS